MLGQPGEAEDQRRWPRPGNPQPPDTLHGDAPPGGGLDGGRLVAAGGQLDIQLDPGRHAMHDRAGQSSGDRVGEGVAAGSMDQTRAGRRTVGLPRAVVDELAANLAGPDDPGAFVFTAPRLEQGGCGPSWCGRRW
jgi:hypothetical protein